MAALDPSKYVTPREVAEYLQITEKAVREYFIHGSRVQYVKLMRKYLILRASFDEWERLHRTSVVRKW